MTRAPIRLLGLSGSLRRASYNTALLRTAAATAPAGVEVAVHDLADVPFYHGDVEREQGFPAAVERLRDAVATADGLLLASPEYNFSTTAVLKNAIDWASRPPDAPLDHKPAALLSAAGRSGGRRAQTHLRDILAHNAVDVLEAAVQVAGARNRIVEGEPDDEASAEIRALVRALAARVEERRRGATQVA